MFVFKYDNGFVDVFRPKTINEIFALTSFCLV